MAVSFATVYAPRYRRDRSRTGNSVEVLTTSQGGDAARGLLVTCTPDAGTKAFRQGALSVALTRAAGNADTTWDGNPDTAMNVVARTNATGNAASEGAIRGASIQGRNSGTNLNWVLGLNLNGRNDSGKQCVQIHGMDVRIENYGNVGTEVVGIDVNMSDENSNVDPHDKFGIRIRNTDQSGMGAVDAALHISHTSTNGFTAFLKSAAAAGDGVVTRTGSPGTPAYALLVDVAGTLHYVPAYTAAQFAA